MRLKTGLFISILIILVVFPLAGAEFSDGLLRLVLHEKTGRFSLYALNGNKAEALFADEDPRTSFLSVLINDRSYKMGDSSAFSIRLGPDRQTPSFVFQSAFMTVTQEFTFIKSAGSSAINGVKITFTLENRADRQVSAGARFLLDTKLGEGSRFVPFSTNRRTINAETQLVLGAGDEQYWTDTNNTISLTGSFITGSPQDPDSIHIANWKRLSDVSWKSDYQSGRAFNMPPYSIRDTAVCYYFEPRNLGRGEKRNFAFFLTLNDSALNDAALNDSPINVYVPSESDSEKLIVDLIESEPGVRDQDLAAIRQLILRIESHITLGTATEDELAAMEMDLNRLRSKYSLGNYSR